MNKFTPQDRQKLKEAWDNLQEAYDTIYDLLKKYTTGHEMARLRAYGLGYAEAGLGIGDALPCPAAVNTFIEEVLDNDLPEEEEE